VGLSFVEDQRQLRNYT